MRPRLGVRSARAAGAAAAFGVAVAALVLAACSTQAKAVGQGGQCFAATDCQEGLVCVPQTDGRMACTTDISGIVHLEDAAVPREAAPPREAAAGDARPGPDGGPTPDSGMPPDSAPPADSAPPDSSMPPDAGD